ncbi:MAG: cell filamentation protein Fic, partial [Bacteroidia bacterium]
MEENNNFIIYNNPNGEVRVDVFVQDETVWLTQKSLAELFDTSTQNITTHLKNIYEDAELQENATCKEILQVQIEGKREVSRNTK